METIAFWAPWVAMALHIAAPFYLIGRAPNTWVTIGVVTYVLTWFISNQWQIALWLPAYGVIAQEDAYGLALRLKTNAEQTRQVLYLGLFFTVSVLGARQIPYPKVNVKLITYKGFPVPVLRGSLTHLHLPSFDLQAKLVWLILLIAEAFAELEYIQCKMLIDPIGRQDLMLSQIWGLEVSRYACGRALGTISPFVAPTITLFWLSRVIMARRGNAGESRS